MAEVWLENPGYQPVDDDVLVEYMMKIGEKDIYKAGCLDWVKCSGNSPICNGASIVSYRIISQPAPDEYENY